MAVPKRRTSSTNRDMRRSHDHLPNLNTVECPNCLEPMLPHRMCPNCGQYRGKVIKESKED